MTEFTEIRGNNLQNDSNKIPYTSQYLSIEELYVNMKAILLPKYLFHKLTHLKSNRSSWPLSFLAAWKLAVLPFVCKKKLNM